MAPIEPIPLTELWVDPFHLMSIREIFIAVFRDVGVKSDATSAAADEPKTPAELIDLVIDVNNVHSVIPSLRVRCGAHARVLFLGVLSMWGKEYRTRA